MGTSGIAWVITGLYMRLTLLSGWFMWITSSIEEMSIETGDFAELAKWAESFKQLQ